jgi:hypothetical protein
MDIRIVFRGDGRKTVRIGKGKRGRKEKGMPLKKLKRC